MKEWKGYSIPAKDAKNFSGNFIFPQRKEADECYSCFYCHCDDAPLVQFGYECSPSEEWNSRTRMVSPEDENAVEVCINCLKYAISLLER